MKSFTEAILATESIGTKVGKFEALSGLDESGKRLLYETENPYRVFGIKKWDKPSFYASSDPSFDEFFTLLDSLHSRQLTGNAAKVAVTVTLSKYSEQTSLILERVLKKDLKCGAGKTTFESVYPDLNIPGFDIMLCSKIEHSKNEQGKIIYPKYNWKFPCYGSVKYDGMRLLTLVENGNIEYLSRSGKSADQWNGLFDEELIRMEKLVGEPIVVDGEALAGDFQSTAKAKGSSGDKSGMRFFVFDWMLLSEWKNQNCPNEQLLRSVTLESMVNSLGLKKIVNAKNKILNSIEEATEFYTEVIDLGLPGQDEGLIIKQLNGLYYWDSKKRTQVWAKWKPVIDVDIKIVGVFKGKEHTKNENHLGGFYVEGEDENGNKIKSKVGGFKVNSKKFKDWIDKFAKDRNINLQEIYDSGVSKDEFFRTYAWENQDQFIGQTCTVETQELSMAENSEFYSLRFPQFLCLREDK